MPFHRATGRFLAKAAGEVAKAGAAILFIDDRNLGVGGGPQGDPNSRDNRPSNAEEVARIISLAALGEEQMADDTTVFTPGADIEILSNEEARAAGIPTTPVSTNGNPHFRRDPCTGKLVLVKKRRRRKRMLSCSDKADMAFVIGQLGKGQLASTTISALIARCG